MLRPTHAIGWIVTNKSKEYQSLTEKWLHNNGIRCNHLLMREDDKNELFKSNIYRDIDAFLFIESSYSEAKQIAKNTGKEVLCIEANRIIHEGMINEIIGTNTPSRYFLDLVRIGIKVIKRDGWQVFFKKTNKYIKGQRINP